MIVLDNDSRPVLTPLHDRNRLQIFRSVRAAPCTITTSITWSSSNSTCCELITSSTCSRSIAASSPYNPPFVWL